jgi:hypothetical protein
MHPGPIEITSTRIGCREHMDCGVVETLAPHDLSMAIALRGAPEAIDATHNREQALLRVKFTDSSQATIHLAQHGARQRRFDVRHELFEISYDHSDGASYLRFAGPDELQDAFLSLVQQHLLDVDDSGLVLQSPEPLRRQLSRFIAACKSVSIDVAGDDTFALEVSTALEEIRSSGREWTY